MSFHYVADHSLCSQTEGGVCRLQLQLLASALPTRWSFPSFCFSVCIHWVSFSLGCKMAQTEKLEPGLGSIHHQFTLSIKVTLTRQRGRTLSGKHRSKSLFSTGQSCKAPVLNATTTTCPTVPCSKNYPIRKLQTLSVWLMLWRSWRLRLVELAEYICVWILDQLDLIPSP